ncbi:hypothetical protein [Variovorax sp. GB1P17]|uniref:hypothetical protein n=1 Tax=Variovorax sp. GB1P17 TaxID=3443740 RepID=UPI003F47D205
MPEARHMDLTLPLVDIAQALACASYPGDDRDRYRLYQEWAQDFQADFMARVLAGRRPDETYREDVAAFARSKAAAYGFMPGEASVIGGRFYSQAQLAAAVRCCEALFEAMVRAQGCCDGDACEDGASWALLDSMLGALPDALPEALKAQIRERI